jgi:DNA-binding CsgD family transcriptional regulator/tetratricopeptide (TPR) repeat protein
MLLEREQTLAALERAVADAAAGRGSVVLVTGEAGIGKTSLVRAFADDAADRARLLLSACDDLMASRTLGPLRDAVLGSEPVEDPFSALLDELAAETPTVLVVEDVHWADDATLDVLGYAARRIEPLGAVIVLTFRDDEIDAHHPLHRFLGVLAGCPVHRVALAPLSLAAVRALCAGTGAHPGALHRATRGNPFFVTEALASPHDVPVSVMEAVLARVGRLGAECREALDQLSVVPSHVSIELATGLLGPRLDALAEAEAAGVLEVRADRIAFRHELARRAIERALPELRRQQLNAAVVAVLSMHERPERARVMHHAVQARDVDTVIAVGPAAGREAAQAGSHRQALAHYESVLPHANRLPLRERAQLLDSYAWELYNALRFRDAVDVGRMAAQLYVKVEDPVALGGCLVRVSRHLWMAGETDAAEVTAQQAVAILEPTGDEAALAHASLYEGAMLAMTDDPQRAAPILDHARGLALRSGRRDFAALALNYLGIARVELGDPGGLQLLRDSIDAAMAARQYEYAARGYCNLVELLARGWHLDELEETVAEGLRFARERGFWSHAYNLQVHRCIALLRRGRWDPALAGLRELVDSIDAPGMLYAYSVPWLGRLLARRGDPAAHDMLATAWEQARSQRLIIGVAYAGLAYVEWAWLAAVPDLATEISEELLPRLENPGAAPFRAELLRYLARAGLGDPVHPWPSIDDPYERAVDLVYSGDPDATVEGVRVLDGLGAAPAAALAREHLRAMGERVPRGPRAGTPANAAGLTERQLAVLALVSEGMTNAEIADRLVVSVRTVDHHVAAVLTKLGVRSRRDAAAAAHTMGIDLVGLQSDHAGLKP